MERGDGAACAEQDLVKRWVRTRGVKGGGLPSQASKPVQRAALGSAWMRRAMAGLSRPNARGPERPAARRSAPARRNTSFHVRPGWLASTGTPPSGVTLPSHACLVVSTSALLTTFHPYVTLDIAGCDRISVTRLFPLMLFVCVVALLNEFSKMCLPHLVDLSLDLPNLQ